MSASLGDDEINDFLFHIDLKWPHRGVHHSTVDTHERTLGLIDEDFACTEGMNTAMIENLTAVEQIEALDKLRHFGMIYH